MTKINKIATLLIALMAIALVLPVSQAQILPPTPTLYTTTLSSAVPLQSGNTSINLSTTNMLAANSQNGTQTALYVDHELMWVISITDTTHAVVARGKGQTRPYAHASGATVYFGSPNSNFSSTTPVSGEAWGACTASAEPSLPRIYTISGHFLDCLGGQWVITSGGGPKVYGSTVASATTIAATGNAFTVSGTTAIATITVPNGFAAGNSLTLIPSGIFTTTTAGNIALASTAVVNKALIMTWTGSKWVPSY